MKEINRYQVADSDVWLLHVRDDDEGQEFIWVALCPPEIFSPEEQGECFIVAGDADGFAGLASLADALARCAHGCDAKLPVGEMFIRRGMA